MTTLRFGPFVWPVNPTEIRVEGGRSTREALFPSPSLQEEGEKLSRVTGRGVFTGPDAAAQFSALHALLETGGAEILTVPEYGPLRAILTELILLRGSMRMVEYTFAFRESPMESASSPCREQTTMLQEGETLWHLAARLAIPIEQLLTLNPKIPEPWSAKAGTEVRIQ